ncbi:alpha-(1,3)-fucosyltransferase 10 [Bufo gargarizans]|uniref:alpha-(1,3)-fucosyltransferase 10 n=1 Tax=Bufo gargarizans TaxID=30331 RepID=UPI001CF508F7|nr:alpha-(1,3)-fucosyltransferase 10 [Bufo gargarizans]XP_044161093.1 alpha-(1,3)-fucosyltransferase 10 [Bufo gargarizans]
MIKIWGVKFWVSCLIIAFFFLLVTLQVIVELGNFEKQKVSLLVKDAGQQKKSNPLLKRLHESILSRKLENGLGSYPILLWWSPLTGETGKLGRCGEETCLFTINRTYLQNPMTKAFLFYGTDFNTDSLPLPRKPYHEWALFHEESPKNNYKLFHPPTITMFNHTATFSRHSHLPLTSQYLEDLETLTSLEYFVSVQKKNVLRRKLAPVVYVQSDCDPPSDRDTYIQELMKYVPVDSYGECLHNRDLPPQVNNSSFMDDRQFYRILAQYKFILAFENAVCEDYITEKLWRPLKLGCVPIYYGATNIEDWLPSKKSVIIVDKFSHPRELAHYIKQLDRNDSLYLEYLDWKLQGHISNIQLIHAIKDRMWGVQDVTQDNYIDAFECMVCRRVWDNIRLQRKGLQIKQWKADSKHLSCPAPKPFPFLPEQSSKNSMRELWKPSFEQSKKEAKALRLLVNRNRNFTSQEFWNLVFKH